MLGSFGRLGCWQEGPRHGGLGQCSARGVHCEVYLGEVWVALSTLEGRGDFLEGRVDGPGSEGPGSSIVG